MPLRTASPSARSGLRRARADDHLRRDALLLGALQATAVEAGREIRVGEQDVADGPRHGHQDHPGGVAASQSDESGWPYPASIIATEPAHAPAGARRAAKASVTAGLMCAPLTPPTAYTAKATAKPQPRR